jgi:fructose-1,6-bisphosphatase I
MATNTNGEPGAAVQEAINTEIITLTRFLTEEQSKHKEATGDFTYVTVRSISLLACADVNP